MAVSGQTDSSAKQDKMAAPNDLAELWIIVISLLHADSSHNSTCLYLVRGGVNLPRF